MKGLLSILPVATMAMASASSFKAGSLDYATEFSLYPPYVDGNGNNNNWEYDALISRDKWVQLTPDFGHSTGWIFSKEPFESHDWSIEFYFGIHGNKAQGTLAADGVAFWFTEEPFSPGNAFGYKENFKGLGVFFDAYPNSDSGHEHPWISAMIGDGIKRYNHDEDGGEHALPGCHRDFLSDGGQIQARVSYVRGALKVETKIGGGDYSTCLFVNNVELPQKGYIGFTAKNGALAAIHEIYAITTARVIPHSGGMFQGSLLLDDAHGGKPWGKIFFIFFVCGAIYTYYAKKNSEHNRKHF